MCGSGSTKFLNTVPIRTGSTTLSQTVKKTLGIHTVPVTKDKIRIYRTYRMGKTNLVTLNLGNQEVSSPVYIQYKEGLGKQCGRPVGEDNVIKANKVLEDVLLLRGGGGDDRCVIFFSNKAVFRIRIQEVKKPRKCKGSLSEYRTGNIKVRILQ